MAKKMGEDIAKDFLDRGRRELGGAIMTESNVAQPMYPSRGGYEPPKEAEAPAKQESVIDSRMREAEASKEDPGRDDPDMDRE
jgi:hypothetical protein